MTGLAANQKPGWEQMVWLGWSHFYWNYSHDIAEPSTPVPYFAGLSQTLRGQSPPDNGSSGYHNYHSGLQGSIPPTSANNWLSLCLSIYYLAECRFHNSHCMYHSDGIKSLTRITILAKPSIKLVHYAGDADTMLILTLQLPSWPSQ